MTCRRKWKIPFKNAVTNPDPDCPRLYHLYILSVQTAIGGNLAGQFYPKVALFEVPEHVTTRKITLKKSPAPKIANQMRLKEMFPHEMHPLCNLAR